MKTHIKQLEKDISNKIAAGEVVERPLAVVKELVENAIDAGATKITVEIKDAGKSLIRITDNGSGIYPEELKLAFERHSTSKIRTINDIYNIASLGFRGEALASIASVSIVEMISKHKEYEMGKKIVLEGGKVVEETPLGAPQGTTIFVKDLFFNTPARLKFLKSNNAEQNAISDIMNKLALSHPEIAFKYIVGGHNIFMTPGNGKLYDVILNLYQRNLAKNLITLSYNEHDIEVGGFISTIELTRGNRQNQIVFVNNRYVKSKLIEDAVGLAYRTFIPHNRFPIVFLNIEVDPSLVDININPAKTEIRFHQEGLVKDLIYKAIKAELNRYNLIPSKPLNSRPVENKEVLKLYNEQAKTIEKKTDSLPVTAPKDIKEEIKEVVKPKSTYSFNNIHKENLPSREEVKVLNDSLKRLHETPEKRSHSQPLVREEVEVFKQEVKPVISEPLKKINPVSTQPLQRETLFVEEVYEPSKPMFEKEEETIYDGLNYVGQVFNTYLLFQKEKDMYLMDQHAAHEKVLYEEFVESFKNASILSQVILEPITFNLSYLEYDKIIQNSKHFEKLGFFVEAFGDKSIIIREIPQLFNIQTSKKIMQDLIDRMDTSLPNERFVLSLESLMQQSCKAAIKANDRLDYMEVKSLIKRLKTLNDPYTCPHGRPIIITISQSELEKKFNRT